MGDKQSYQILNPKNIEVPETAEFIDISMTVEQAQWFIQRLQEALAQLRLKNEMLKNQIAKLKEVKR